METIKRKSSRAILLTPQNEVLLIKIKNPTGTWSGWITPGGGIEPDESEEMALYRELNEELGLKELPSAKKVWTRFHRYSWNGKRIEQEENFFLIQLPKFHASFKALETEMLDFQELRWWRLEELMHTREEFAPRSFPARLEELIKMGVPAMPVDVGI